MENKIVLLASEKITINDYEEAVKSNLDGALIRLGYSSNASEFIVNLDSSFEDNYAGFIDKTKLGFYWNSNANSKEKIEEEINFIKNQMQDNNYDFPFYLDITSGNNNDLNNSYLFCKNIIESGFRAGIIVSIENLNSVKNRFSDLECSFIVDNTSSISDCDGYIANHSSIINGCNDYVYLCTIVNDIGYWENTKTDISGSIVTINEPEKIIYNGNQIYPEITVSCNDKTLISNVNYDINISDNINAGSAKIIITGKGDYTNSLESSFVIRQKDITLESIEISCGDPDEDGVYNLENLSIYDKDRDEYLIYNTDPEEYTDYECSIEEKEEGKDIYSDVTVTGVGNYTGTKVAYNHILTGFIKTDITNESEVTIRYEIENIVYDGNPKELNFTVLDKDNNPLDESDYEIIYSNNINAGIANATVEGRRYYENSKDFNFTINKCSIANAKFECDKYSDSEYYDISTLKVINNDIILKKNIDYTLEITESKDEDGIIINTVVATGIGNYAGIKDNENTFKVGDSRPYLDINNFEIFPLVLYYTKSVQTPYVTSGVYEYNKDYEVYFDDSILPGNYKGTIKGIGDYQGTLEFKYIVEEKSVTGMKITFGEPDNKGCYSIKNIKVMDSTVELEENVDYKYYEGKVVESSSGYNETEIIVKGINNYKDQKSVFVRTSIRDIYSGKKVILDNNKVYPLFCSKDSDVIKSGIYYLWDENLINGRIRITSNKENIECNGTIVGWVVFDELIREDIINISEKVIVNGELNTKPDMTGNKIYKSNEYMFVINIIENSNSELVYGLASSINRTIQGWCKSDILKKVN